jgi:hypothetical protein
MDSADPLSQLADIHLPTEVGFWPPAPGWWLLLALLLAAMLYAAFRGLQLWRRRHMCSIALRELEKCYQPWRTRQAADENAARLRLINDVNAVLRRVALRHYPHTQVAGLSGEQWVEFLRTHGRSARLDGPLSSALAQGRFAPRCEVDADQLHAFATDWIKGMYLARIEATPTTRSSSELAPEHA